MRSLTRRSARLLTAALGTALLAACGGSGDGTTGIGPISGPPTQSATVQATPSLQFTPGSVAITAGGTVTFVFGSVPHDLYFDDAPPGAPANITTPSSNTSATVTFSRAGTFTYNCHIHPGMKGTVTVQ